jgi:hypothetical protein
MFAFKAGRHILLPRGMDQGDVVSLLSEGWELAQTISVRDDRMPGFVGRAGPTVYRLSRRNNGGLPA